jgi:hypothetical protein
MTRKIGKILLVQREKPERCAECGELKELRPYGKDGARICFQCAMATPESRAEAEHRFGLLLGNRDH